MKKFLLTASTVSFIILLCVTAGLAIEVAPRISDREIVERLSRLEEGQKKLESRLDDLRSEMNSRFESMDKRFDDLRSEMNSRFDLLTWIFGLFITISLLILGFVIRMQWLMQKRQTQTETKLQIQTEEVKFLRDIILKLFPPKGVL